LLRLLGVTRAFFTTFAGLAIACSPDDRNSANVTATDSVGVRIVESRDPIWERTGSSWRLQQTPVIHIRGDASDGRYFLYRVTAAHRLANGSIVVGNSGTRQLLWFDSTGAFVRSIGGAGEGPGEFNNISDIFRCRGDTLIVSEGRRLSFIDPDGEFVRTAPVAGRILRASGTLGGISESCSAVLAIEGEYRYPEPGEAVHQLPHVLAWVDIATGKRDTLLVFPGPDLYPEEIRGQQASARLPFGKVPVWATDGKLVAYGAADDFELRLFDRSADLRQIIRWRAEFVPVEGSPFEQFRSAQDAYIRANPENAQDILRAGEFPIPEHMPAYADALFDDAGNVWVRQYLHDPGYALTPQSDKWWVFDTTGAWLGTLDTPLTLRVLAIEHGVVIGVARDSADVESLALFSILR
jgi:hypothetical protein